MQLKFNRMPFGIALLVLTGIGWGMMLLALKAAEPAFAMIGMLVLAPLILVILFLMARPPVVAAIRGDTLRVGRQTAHLGDILRVAIGADRSLSFAVRARDENGFWAGAYGEHELALPLRRIDGGRKAAESFVAQVEAARQAVTPLEAAPAAARRPRRDGVDPEPVQQRPAARAGFGRKGL